MLEADWQERHCRRAVGASFFSEVGTRRCPDPGLTPSRLCTHTFENFAPFLSRWWVWDCRSTKHQMHVGCSLENKGPVPYYHLCTDGPSQKTGQPTLAGASHHQRSMMNNFNKSSEHPKKSIDCGKSISNRTNSYLTPWEANTFYSFCTQRDILRSEEPLTRGKCLDFARACTTHPSNHLQPHRYPHCPRIFF